MHAFARKISIHAPRVGSDPSGHDLPGVSGYFNPRSPCGERRSGRSRPRLTASISIHAPRVGSDPPGWICMRATCISIHAPRVGSDPIRTCPLLLPGQISIHAPRVGSDNRNHWRGSFVTDFNPRSPCGERRFIEILCVNNADFNPRSPCGERLPENHAGGG